MTVFHGDRFTAKMGLIRGSKPFYVVLRGVHVCVGGIRYCSYLYKYSGVYLCEIHGTSRLYDISVKYDCLEY